MKEVKLLPNGWPCLLQEAPIGLFYDENEELAMKVGAKNPGLDEFTRIVCIRIRDGVQYEVDGSMITQPVYVKVDADDYGDIPRSISPAIRG